MTTLLVLWVLFRAPLKMLMKCILYPLKKLIWNQYIHLKNCLYCNDNKIVPKIFKKQSILSHDREKANVSQLSELIAKNGR